MEDPSKEYLTGFSRATPASGQVDANQATSTSAIGRTPTPAATGGKVGTPSTGSSQNPLPTMTSTPVPPPTPSANAQYGLVVNRGGTGAGKVVSSPPGIDCGASCSALFSAGAVVTLTAVPNSDSVFSGWAGGCAGMDPCSLSMTVNRFATAVFSLEASPTPSAVPQYALAVSKGGTGSGVITSTPSGIACGAACIASYPAGTTVSLTAAPSPDAVFAGWLGACSGVGPCTVTMTMNQSVSAVFTVNPTPTSTPMPQYVLAASKGGNGTGTVTSSPVGISCGDTCAASFPAGATVTLQAVPAPDSVFVAWQGDCTGSSCTLTMSANLTVTAVFSERSTGSPTPTPTQGNSSGKTGALSVQKGGDGFGRVVSAPDGINCGTNCTATFLEGATVILTATPLSGSVFAGWLGDCSGTDVCVLRVGQYTSVAAIFNSK